jgi:GNAT superfamily N-acetyltransferase
MTSKKSTAAKAKNKVRAQPLIAVRDVRRRSRWYARLLGAERTSELMRSDQDHLYDRLLSGGAHRSKGAGRALMRAAEDWARSQGCRQMASDTWLDNEPWQRAHEALGFEVVDRCVHFRKAL